MLFGEIITIYCESPPPVFNVIWVVQYYEELKIDGQCGYWVNLMNVL